MKILRIEQDEKKSRIEDAIYFSDGRVALLFGSPDKKYEVEEWSTFEELEKSAPDEWAYICEMHVCEQENFKVTAGETSYGGAGFIAVFDKEANEYKWVLHLNNCNNFKSVSIRDGVVIAMSDYSYPNGTEFKLPMNNPEQIEVTNL